MYIGGGGVQYGEGGEQNAAYHTWQDKTNQFQGKKWKTGYQTQRTTALSQDSRIVLYNKEEL
jgi:hypothetical protein